MVPGHEREPGSEAEFAFTRRLVERSLFLYERLALANGRFRSAAQPGSGTAARLDRWRLEVALGDDSLFEKRLRLDGLNSERAARLMEFILPESAPLPAWAVFLNSVQRRMKEKTSSSLRNDKSPQFGFDELLWPFVQCARETLEQRNPAGWHLLEQTAIRDLERCLAYRLALLARHTLMFEFSLWKSVAAHRAFYSLGSSNSLYQGFVREHLHDGCTRLFEGYPVLARLLAERAQQWVGFFASVLERLHHDRSDIARSLLSSDRLGTIARIESEMGDSHRGGQTVLTLQTASGERFLYKPKPLDGDRNFSILVRWLNSRTSIHLPCIPAVYRTDYGWQRYTEALPCPDQDAVQRYFHRAGMLLSLMYVFGGSDCHHDNIIAHGEYPMLVDLETLLSPTSGPAEDTVHRTAMLPRWDCGPDGVMIPAPSGLATTASATRNVLSIDIAHVNSDRMRFVHRKRQIMARSSVYCGGKFESADGYGEQVVRGFTEVYTLLKGNVAAILGRGEGEVVPAWRRLRLRYVFRETRTYAALLASAFGPSAMTTGIDFSIQLDGVARAMLGCKRGPRHWNIIKAEHEALSRGDIPVFYYRTAHTALSDGTDIRVPKYFKCSGVDSLRQRVQKRMGQRDLNIQIANIRAALTPKSDA